MNLFDVPEDEYANKSKIRIRDASLLAQELSSKFANSDQVNIILDIGCGTGYSTLELAARFPNARVIGVDPNPAYIDRVPVMSKNVEFYCADISEKDNFANFCMLTDINEASVNIAISTYWLTSLCLTNRTQAIENVKRLLRHDGYFYILDLIWTDADAVIHSLNQQDQWKTLIKQHNTEANTFEVPLPTSDTAPTDQQVSEKWIQQFTAFEDLELFQIVRNRLYYRFQSLDDMLHVLESICTTLSYITEEQSSRNYFVEFIRRTFDQCFVATKNFKLGYYNLMVVAYKKALDSN